MADLPKLVNETQPRRAYAHGHLRYASQDSQEVPDALDAALRNALPKDRMSYSKVGVLLIHWDNDDLNVVKNENALAAAFRDVYNFKTEFYVIPHKDEPNRSLMQKMHKFADKYTKSDELSIYVYSGHADARPQGLWSEDYECRWL